MYHGKLVLNMEHLPEKIYELLFNIGDWDKLLPHCKRIEIEKQDDKEQIAIIEMEYDTIVERIRTIRTFEKNKWITFNQVPPPKPFTCHKGKWAMEKISSGTKVTVTHDIEVGDKILGWFIERIAWIFYLRRINMVTLRKVQEKLSQ